MLKDIHFDFLDIVYLINAFLLSFYFDQFLPLNPPSRSFNSFYSLFVYSCYCLLLSPMEPKAVKWNWKLRRKDDCIECKKSKSICDQTQPHCNLCISKGILCEYHKASVPTPQKLGRHKLKEISKTYETQIEVQKGIAAYWKGLYDRLYAKVELDMTEVRSFLDQTPHNSILNESLLLDNEKQFSLIEGFYNRPTHVNTQDVPPSWMKTKSLSNNVNTNVKTEKCKSNFMSTSVPHDKFQIEEKHLYLMNRLIQNYPSYGTPIEFQTLASAQDLWNQLTCPLDPYDVDKIPIQRIVILWKYTMILVAVAYTFSRTREEAILWKNANRWLSIVLKYDEGVWPCDILPYVINNLSFMSQMFFFKQMPGAAVSTLVLTRGIYERSKSHLDHTLFYGMVYLLIMMANGPKERMKWLIESKEVAKQQRGLEIKYLLAYCANTMSIYNEDDPYEDLMATTNVLSRIEEMMSSGELEKEFVESFQVYLYAMRAEVSVRWGNYEIGMEWIDSSYQTLKNIGRNGGMIKMLCSGLRVFNASPFIYNSKETSVVIELMDRLNIDNPNVL